MKKVLVLGASGMAGHIVYSYLKELGQYELVNVVYRQPLNNESVVLDVRNQSDVKKLIVEYHPDIIINCIGVLIKGSKESPENAIYINAYFPHFLVKVADEIGAKVIHISTDCVFSGKKGLYKETDFKDADDVYGRSKALGEIQNEKHLTLRTSIIGPELKDQGEGLFHWLMTQTGEVNGYVEAIWGGVTTFELAKAIHKSIENNLTGLIHLSNGVGISKYDLLLLMQDIYHKSDIHVSPLHVSPIDKSIASSSKFEFGVPSYRQMIEELYIWMRIHSGFYQMRYSL